jgi:glycosyltransferase involved in cell wall biosynthesis
MNFLVVTLVKDDLLEFWKTRNSVLKQTYTPRHLVIDSSKSSEIRDSQNQSDFFTIITCPPKGIYGAMNQALDYIVREISGKYYVLFLNSGDVFESDDVLEKLSLKIEPEDSWIYTGYRVHDPATDTSRVIRPVSNTSSSQLYARNPINHQSLFVLNTALHNVGQFNESYRVAADWDYITRLRKITEGRFVDIISTKFVLGGFSSINRKIGNRELLHLRSKHLSNSRYPSVKSLCFFLYREVRLKIFVIFFEKRPRLLGWIRKIMGWR